MRHAGELADVVALAKQRELALTGGLTDPMGNFSPAPAGTQGTFEGADPHAVSPVVSPVADQVTHYGQSLQPRTPNVGDRVLHGAGAVAAGLPTLLAPPVAGAYYLADGYGHNYEDALRHGATDDQARGVGMVAGPVEAALSATHMPGGRLLSAGVERLASPFLRAAARTGVNAATTATFAGGTQAASNLLARETYDPSRSPWKDVGAAAITGGILGAGAQLARESAAGLPVPGRLSQPLPQPMPQRQLRETQPILQLGGAHRDVRGNPGYHSHHMPSNAASPHPRGDGPAIAILSEDHPHTASWGNDRASRAYRAEQARLIEQGDFAAAQQMDIDDIRSLVGGQYDEAIQQMLKYTRDQGY
jgi:hypothetical protein